MDKLNYTKDDIACMEINTIQTRKLWEDWLSLCDENEAQRKLLREIAEYATPCESDSYRGMMINESDVYKIRALIGDE